MAAAAAWQTRPLRCRWRRPMTEPHQDSMPQTELSRDPSGGKNIACIAAAKLAASEEGILALLTVIWGFLGSFGLLSLSLPPLDLLLLPPLAFLGRPMLEAGGRFSDTVPTAGCGLWQPLGLAVLGGLT